MGWIEGSAAATYLYLLVSYLERLQLLSLPDEILGRLSVRHGFGRLSLKAAHAMMDAYMLGGQDFGAVLTRRNLSIAWNTLILPVPSPCKRLLMPLNLCVPGRLRIG